MIDASVLLPHSSFGLPSIRNVRGVPTASLKDIKLSYLARGAPSSPPPSTLLALQAHAKRITESTLSHKRRIESGDGDQIHNVPRTFQSTSSTPSSIGGFMDGDVIDIGELLRMKRRRIASHTAHAAGQEDQYPQEVASNIGGSGGLWGFEYFHESEDEEGEEEEEDDGRDSEEDFGDYFGDGTGVYTNSEDKSKNTDVVLSTGVGDVTKDCTNGGEQDSSDDDLCSF